MLPAEGRFEFAGLARASYSVFASVKGYTLEKTSAPAEKKRQDRSVERTTYAPGVAPPFSIDGDINDFVIKLHPENRASQ